VVNTMYGIQEDYRTIVVPRNAKGKRLKIGKLEVYYPTDTSVELKTDFQRDFNVVFPAGKEIPGVRRKGEVVKTVMQYEVKFRGMPGKTYVISKDQIVTEF